MRLKCIAILLFLMVFGISLQAGVMMQGFYWDVPSGGTWYNTMKNQANNLRYMAGGKGINRMYFPPPSKSDGGGYSMGYNPYDYYDVGQYNQKGTVETRFGSQAELKNAISTYRSKGIVCMADIVLNHRSGGGSQYNPRLGYNTWTDFTGTASGKCTWQWWCFHPNNYCSGDPGAFGGYPDVCYSAGEAYNDMKGWLNWLKSTSNAGFNGGWRFDYVKGLHTWVVKDMRNGTGYPWCVGEYWDANTGTLDWWANATGCSVFDFALYYTMKEICVNTGGGGWLPNVFDQSKSFAAKNPTRAVPFVGNHDTDEIFADKMMAYAFILTYQGYPCIWWKDYFDYGLASLGGQWGNGIKQLVWVREQLAAGGPNIQIMKSNDGDLIVYGSYGYSSASPGYIVAINDNANNWRGSWVCTYNGYLKSKNLKCYAWYSSKSGQNYQPNTKWCNSSGWVEVWAPPRGYAVYAPDGL